MYSQFACKNTCTIQTECSKLIRSEWFASNIYLLVLSFRSSNTILFPTQLGLCTAFLLWGVQHYVHGLQYAFHLHPQQTQSCDAVCFLHKHLYDLCLH